MTCAAFSSLAAAMAAAATCSSEAALLLLTALLPGPADVDELSSLNVSIHPAMLCHK